VQKEIIIIIGGPGNWQYLIDGLTAKGFVVILKSREVTLEAKKQGIEQLFENRCF
jgi:hypothetical protein